MRPLHPLWHVPIAAVLLAGCPWISAETHNNNLDPDSDTEPVGVVDVDSDGFAVDDDCDDNDASIHPDAVERCDGVDNNCNELVDEGFSERFVDADGDGWGTAVNVDRCDEGPGTAAQTGDCDDIDGSVNPAATEYCDGVDTDCNPDTTEAGLATATVSGGMQQNVQNLITADVGYTLGDADGHVALALCDGIFDTTLFSVDNGYDVTVVGLGDVTLRPRDANSRVFYMVSSVVSIANVVIENGLSLGGGTSAAGVGGGLYCEGSDLTLSDVTFQNNGAPFGGAIGALDCTIVGTSVDFIGNQSGNGGGLDLTGTTSASLDGGSFAGGSGSTSVRITDSAGLTLTDTLFSYTTEVGITVQGNGGIGLQSVDFPTEQGNDLDVGLTNPLDLGPNTTMSCSVGRCIAR